jgi:PilZ domain-containing protein
MSSHAGLTASIATPAGSLAWSILDHRREQRFVCQGAVKIIRDGPLSEGISGEMLDISNNGFRAAYSGEPMPKGTEFAFRHFFFKGRAQVMWSRELPDGNESGCMVLRD